MRKTTAMTMTALFALASCTAEIPPADSGATRAEHRTTPKDTTETASPGISFDMEDDSMEEETEWICFEAEGWGEQEQTADL